MVNKKNYPPNGKYYMYPCYDIYNNLIGFSSDYEADGAYGKLCVIECGGLYKR